MYTYNVFQVEYTLHILYLDSRIVAPIRTKFTFTYSFFSPGVNFQPYCLVFFIDFFTPR